MKPKEEILDSDENGDVNSTLKKRNRFYILGLSVFTLVILLLIYFQVIYRINSAVDLSKLKAPESLKQQFDLQDKLLEALNSQIALTDDLKTKDTDKDGLSDYNEFKIYKTSPYLADSDSDAISDKDEVTNGTDPLCPSGKVCRQESDLLGDPGDSVTYEDLSGQIKEIVPVSKLRELLVQQGGLTQEQVDQLDDATLQQIYEETLKKIAETK